MRQYETSMTSRLTPILLGCMTLLLATAAQAQSIRSSETVYITLRGGATVYGGELDQTASIGDLNDDGQLNDSNGSDIAWLFQDFGYGLGAEVGYQFTPSLGFGLGFQYASYANLDSDSSPADGLQQINENGVMPQVNAMFRYLPFPNSKLSPFVNMGLAVAVKSNDPSTQDKKSFGFGPITGLGLDYVLTDRLSLFAGADYSFIFPDIVVDGVDPGGQSEGAGNGDDTDFDILGLYNVGLKFNLKPAYVSPEIESMQCPGTLTAGESGSFMVMINEDANQPVTTTWDFGDGSGGNGMTTSHTYTAPGTYTVMATAANRDSDSESCLVTVVEPQIPPTISGCRATPARVNSGDQVTINANVTQNQYISGQPSVTVDFGDGTTGNSLPARHSYSETGTYTVTITATNAYGSDTCTITVTVGDSFCEQITELNPVYFEYRSATLTADARGRLDENIEILRRCPSICVNINGWSDGQEGDAMRISQQRADAVRAYYIANGIDESRVTATGRGVDPAANPKEDPGPGDSRARRADSIPGQCGM